MNLAEIIYLFIAQSTILLALFTWLGKFWANRISINEKARTEAEIEKLKASLNRKQAELNASNESKVHVGKIQYEREFLNYEKMWEFIPSIYDEIRLICSNKHSFEYYKKHYLKLINLNSELSDMAANYYPFIDENIYKAALNCSNVLTDYRGSLDEHLRYLESKANSAVLPSKEMEDSIGELISHMETKFHKSGVELGKAVKSRNEHMIVLPSAI